MLSGGLVRVAAAVTALLAAFGAGAGVMAAVDSPQPQSSGARDIDQAVTTIEDHAAHPVPQSVLQQAAVRGMLSALGDDWATYYNKRDYKQFEQVLGGGYTGVGLWLRRDPSGGALRVLSVQPNSPAEQAGVRRGDRIVAVGGHSVAGEAVALVTDQLRGRAGTEVAVTVEAAGGQLSALTLRRASVADDDVSTAMLPGNVERIRIAAFTAGVGAQVRTLVDAAGSRHLSGIVLDLRDNPGGLLDEAVETASAFLAGGPVVTYVQRGQAARTLDALGGGNTMIPLVVLVDGGTASAAEIVAAALQDRGRAVLMGSQTFGKGTVQAPERLAGGGAIELTVGHYLTPAGQSLENRGITPDVLIPPRTPESVIDSRALEVLSGLTADAGSSGRG